MDRWLWERVQAALYEALAREPVERSQFVAAISDDVIRAEVESLLAADGSALEAQLEKAISGTASHLIDGGDVQTLPIVTSRYRLLELLGTGGMSEVYLAEDLQLGRRVALKLLPRAFNSDRSRVRRFEQEARALSALNHPNILTIFEIGNFDERWFIAMEYVAGEPLSARINRGALPVPEALAVAAQIAAALSVAHQHGILHRDIKPANIMLRDDGLIKLVDFGLAHVSRQQPGSEGPVSVSGLVLGTPSYMSPEQARGLALDERTDLWSLGAVLFEMVTGSKAFDGDSTPDILVAVLDREPAAASSKIPSIPQALDELILKLLSKDRSQRPTSAKEVLDEVQAIRSAMGPPTTRRIWRDLGHRQPSRHAAGQLVRGPIRGGSRPGHRWWVLAAMLLASACVVVWLVTRDADRVTDLTIRPLTAQSGWETSPALSPDGQSVAYCWTESGDRAREVYVKRLDSDATIQLTNSRPDNVIGPLVWSPDGSRIMFKSWEGKFSGGIYVIPKSGGTPRQVVRLVNADLSSTIDWSPDGRLVAFSDNGPGTDRLAIYLLNLETSEKRQLTAPPADHWGDWSPSFSADGRMIAFKRVTAYWLDEIYLAPVAGGGVRQVTNDRRGIYGHAWMTDNSLVLACQRSGSVFGLWQIPLASPARGRSLAAGGVDAIMPSVARKANRVAWVNNIEDVNLYQIATSGAGEPSRVVSSTLRDLAPDHSIDGRIAYTSDRSGTLEVWIARRDGSDQVRVTRFNGNSIGSPRWSSDGRRLAIHSRTSGRSSIYIMDCAPHEVRCSEPREVETGNLVQAVSGWSADGRFLYVVLDRTGQWEVWKQPIAGGEPIQVTRSGAFRAFESSDGKWLYLSKSQKDGRNSIWRIPGPRSGLPPGREELLIGPGEDISHEGWRVASGEIFYVSRTRTRTSETIRAYHIATGRTRSIRTMDNLPTERAVTQIAVSPDSQSLLFSRADKSGSNVMVADFRLGP